MFKFRIPRTLSRAGLVAVVAMGAIGQRAPAAQSNIRPDATYAWQENIGWINWRDADGRMAGVLVGPTVLDGFIWSENVGWINVGDGTPADGTHYANVDGTDFGVNIDPITGELFGFAWGENIGWINFDTSVLGAQAARLDLCTKRFYGYAWGENIGWLNLDDSVHYVAAELEADCNTNGLEDDCEIADGTLSDLDANGRPDECPCSSVDVNCDGTADVLDLGVVRQGANWNESPPADPRADVNGDGTADVLDMGIIRQGANWNASFGLCICP